MRAIPYRRGNRSSWTDILALTSIIKWYKPCELNNIYWSYSFWSEKSNQSANTDSWWRPSFWCTEDFLSCGHMIEKALTRSSASFDPALTPFMRALPFWPQCHLQVPALYHYIGISVPIQDCVSGHRHSAHSNWNKLQNDFY